MESKRKVKDTVKMLPSIVMAATLLSSATLSQAAKSNKVLLDDLKVITLRHGAMTSARRSSPIPQLKCVGGSAGCSSFIPQVVQCYNRGSDGYDIQWECKTDMDNAYRFGKIEVSCEGFDYPDDPYVLTGSCGLEYTIDLTKEGYQQQKQGHNYYGGQNSRENHNHHENRYNSNSYNKRKNDPGLVGNIVMYVIIGLIVYALYKTCWVSSPNMDDGSYRQQPGNNQHRSGPPPPGFRQDYMPNQGGCSSTYDSTYTNTNTNRGAGTSGFGGFWGGAATGGILGYLLGNRGNTYTQTHHRPYGGGWNTGWGSGLGSGWGSSGWGSSAGSSGGGWGSSPSASTGTRSASGFGGTRRR